MKPIISGKEPDYIEDEYNRLNKLPSIKFGDRHSRHILNDIKYDGKYNEIILPMAGSPKHIKMEDAIKIAHFILKHAK